MSVDTGRIYYFACRPTHKMILTRRNSETKGEKGIEEYNYGNGENQRKRERRRRERREK